jgi:hypothetical protein
MDYHGYCEGVVKTLLVGEECGRNYLLPPQKPFQNANAMKNHGVSAQPGADEENNQIFAVEARGPHKLETQRQATPEANARRRLTGRSTKHFWLRW